MIRKHEKGLAFIPLLVILSVGSLLIPAFLDRLDTRLISPSKALAEPIDYYSAESGAEHVLWRLIYEVGFVNTMSSASPTTSYNVNVNNTDVTVSVTMLPPYQPPPPPLSGDEVLRVTKTVSPTTATPDVSQTFTYTIQIENLSQSPQELERLEDLLPVAFSYVPGSTSGITTSDPNIITGGPRDKLKWKYTPNIPFQPGEIKTLTFQATATPSEAVYCNEAEADPEDGKKSTSGPTAKITVGNPESTLCAEFGAELTKTVTPEIALPLKPTTFTYTITVENIGSVKVNLKKLQDVLPPGGFTYVSGSSSGITTSDPTQELQPDGRWKLKWTFPPKLRINPGEIKTQTIQAQATVDTGIYCNETWIKLDKPTQWIYSWPTACVTVPAGFDIEADSGTITIRAHILISGNTFDVRSWQIE